MKNFGAITNAKICGERWPRLMFPTIAAGYAGLSGATAFKRDPEFAALIRNVNGQEMIDRLALDEVISRKVAEADKSE